MIAQLVPIDGDKPININRDVTVVGRKAGMCDLVLKHGSVSKLQCLIIRTDGLLFIRDLGSTNGTKVNGQRVTRGALLPGDELSFASVRFRVHLGPGEPEVDQNDQTEYLVAPPGDDDDGEPIASLSASDIVPDEMGSESDVRLLSDDSES